LRVFITGTSGFIGFHLARTLLEEGFKIHGYDGITDYYDIKLKKDRTSILESFDNFQFTQAMLEDNLELASAIEKFQPEIIIHLAAQAGVRYSLENPRSYVDSNIIGTFNLLEIAKKLDLKHMLIASTSSVYGDSKEMPFNEKENTDSPLTIYAASKKTNEVMAHSYSHLWNLPITTFRFFTVYGPWGRPDMALFKFTEAILNDEEIDVYNFGNMYRDFTYIDDLVKGIRLLMNAIPNDDEQSNSIMDKDTKSKIAPYRIVNIGNSKKVKLSLFIEAIEKELGKQAKKNYLPMQMGDVPATWADSSLLKNLTNYSPETDIKEGVKNFIEWYLNYNNIKP
tara:strand:- start:10315 stop:11331 length:1017 start_codon:yes stop_codon:yes gene_type:complete